MSKIKRCVVSDQWSVISDQWSVISEWVSEWVSDKVTYWAVCGQLKKNHCTLHMKKQRKYQMILQCYFISFILFPCLDQLFPWVVVTDSLCKSPKVPLSAFGSQLYQPKKMLQSWPKNMILPERVYANFDPKNNIINCVPNQRQIILYVLDI